LFISSLLEAVAARPVKLSAGAREPRELKDCALNVKPLKAFIPMRIYAQPAVEY
jgi:hypothetical protein